jgi:hypothetical protein
MDIKVFPRLGVGRSPIPFRPRTGALHERAGQRTVRQVGLGSDLREIREHIPGDPFKRIAWKATARMRKLMVREFESEIVVTHWLLLDVSSTMRAGGPGRSKLDYGLSLCAGFSLLTLFALRTLRAGISFVAFGSLRTWEALRAYKALVFSQCNFDFHRCGSRWDADIFLAVQCQFRAVRKDGHPIIGDVSVYPILHHISDINIYDLIPVQYRNARRGEHKHIDPRYCSSSQSILIPITLNKMQVYASVILNVLDTKFQGCLVDIATCKSGRESRKIELCKAVTLAVTHEHTVPVTVIISGHAQIDVGVVGELHRMCRRCMTECC